MADDAPVHGAEQTGSLPHYPFGKAPRHMFTERQLWDQFGLLPGAPARATVDSQYGLAAVFQVNEARLPGEKYVGDHPDARS